MLILTVNEARCLDKPEKQTMNDDLNGPAPWLQQPVAPSNLDGACDNMSEALDCLHRRLESLTARLKPVTRLPAPLTPQVGQPMPPKPFDASSPLLTSVHSWGRSVSALADKILELEKTLDI